MAIELIVNDRMPDHRTNELVLRKAAQYVSDLLKGFYDMQRQRTRMFRGDITPQTVQWTNQYIWEEPLSSPANTQYTDERGVQLVLSYHMVDDVVDDMWRALRNNRLDNVRESVDKIGISVNSYTDNGFYISTDLLNKSLLLSIIDGQPAPLTEHRLLVTSWQMDCPKDFFNSWLEHRNRLIGQVKTLNLTDDRNERCR